MRFLTPLFLATLVGIVPLFAEEEPPTFAGTLLPLYPQNETEGQIAIFPYFFYTREAGFYDENWEVEEIPNVHQSILLLTLEAGLTKKIDVSIGLEGIHFRLPNKETTRYGDTALYFGYQFILDAKAGLFSDLRFIIGEIFPTGQYDHLDPTLGGLDAAGAGAYQTFLTLIGRKVFYTCCNHAYNWTLSGTYITASRVFLKGASNYGTPEGTLGAIYPGDILIGNLGFEFLINKNLGWGLDLHYQHQNSSSFNPQPTSAFYPGLPSSESFSLAPCIEYNFSAQSSVEAGAWFTVTGRNALAFQSFVANYYYAF